MSKPIGGFKKPVCRGPKGGGNFKPSCKGPEVLL